MDREELYAMLSGSALMGGAKKKKKPSKWNLYVKKHADSGKSIKQLAREYKKKKGGAMDYEDDEGAMDIFGGAKKRVPRPSGGEWRTKNVRFNDESIKLGKRIVDLAKQLYPKEYKSMGGAITQSDYIAFSKSDAGKQLIGRQLRDAWNNYIVANQKDLYSQAELIYLDIGSKALKEAVRNAKDIKTAETQSDLFSVKAPEPVE